MSPKWEKVQEGGSTPKIKNGHSEMRGGVGVRSWTKNKLDFKAILSILSLRLFSEEGVPKFKTFLISNVLQIWSEGSSIFQFFTNYGLSPLFVTLFSPRLIKATSKMKTTSTRKKI